MDLFLRTYPVGSAPSTKLHWSPVQIWRHVWLHGYCMGNNKQVNKKQGADCHVMVSFQRGRWHLLNSISSWTERRSMWKARSIYLCVEREVALVRGAVGHGEDQVLVDGIVRNPIIICFDGQILDDLWAGSRLWVVLHHSSLASYIYPAPDEGIDGRHNRHRGHREAGQGRREPGSGPIAVEQHLRLGGRLWTRRHYQ
jgi:hypothetical protein